MGASWSNPIKSDNDLLAGLISKTGRKDENGLSWSYSKLSPASPESPRSESDNLQSSTLKNFSFKELKTATRNFHADHVLGEGYFGQVFKGWIDEFSLKPTRSGTGMAIAVTKLKIYFQGHQKLLAEINYVGQLRHPNLVRLISYCLEDDEHRVLVYEFVHRGSINDHLFRRNSVSGYSQPLSWTLRMKIALGAAKGLAFLHSDEIRVIYGDLNTSKILLTENYDVKLSDFGLTIDQQYCLDHGYCVVESSYGYRAPEYFMTGSVTSKSNVYSFGVVLLEILSGRRVTDMKWPNGQKMLVEWIKPFLSNKRLIVRVLDPCMRQYSIDHALKLANLKCLSIEPKVRPTMIEVVQELETLQGFE